jgi:hypothetical protein
MTNRQDKFRGDSEDLLDLAAPDANFGIEGHRQLYDSSAALNLKLAIGRAAPDGPCASWPVPLPTGKPLSAQ